MGIQCGCRHCSDGGHNTGENKTSDSCKGLPASTTKDDVLDDGQLIQFDGVVNYLYCFAKEPKKFY